MRNAEIVKKQYETLSGLSLRQEFHEKYSVNKMGYGTWLKSHVQLNKGMKILELGSGKGDFWKANIHEILLHSQLILSDFSEGAISEMKKNYDGLPLEIKQIDIQSIPYEEETFDLVIANSMLYHIPNLDQAISEVCRVLKKGGTFFSATLGENGISSYILETLTEQGLMNNAPTKVSFTLQNGESILTPYFTSVVRKDYHDRLEVTKSEDLVAYIYSMASMHGLSEEHITNMIRFYESKKNQESVIEIPKEYGTFISIK
jgi:ubiquinone/menaquinone biosynthesis C-methylase UbiE